MLIAIGVPSSVIVLEIHIEGVARVAVLEAEGKKSGNLAPFRDLLHD
jgi:hypothetical protein